MKLEQNHLKSLVFFGIEFNIYVTFQVLIWLVHERNTLIKHQLLVLIEMLTVKSLNYTRRHI